MRAVWWLVTPVVLATLVAGSDGDAIKPRSEPSRSDSQATSHSVPPSTSKSPSSSLSFAEAFESAARAGMVSAQRRAEAAHAGMVSARNRAKIAAFMAKAKLIEEGVVGAGFELNDVQYTSPTDAAADFDNDKNCVRVCTSVVLTTKDNWAHATGLAVPDTLALYVAYTPLGEGAVAIKAMDEPFEEDFPRQGKPTRRSSSSLTDGPGRFASRTNRDLSMRAAT